MTSITSVDVIAILCVLLAGNGLVQYLVSYYLNKKDKKAEKNNLILKTLSIQSYCNLKQECNTLIEKGYATEAERRFLYKMYDNYKCWGWNGDMDALIERVDRLPYLEIDRIR